MENMVTPLDITICYSHLIK